MNDIDGAYRSNVPLSCPSIETDALPCSGPVTVYQVTVRPLNEKDAVAPSRWSMV